MNLLDVVRRSPQPEPWVEREKIPWDEPNFSRRMLKEHLSQAHDAASRRFDVIDRHVAWIHHHVLEGKPGKVLDLGCGPGFYTARLTELGHTCVGIDFSPASIDYARRHLPEKGETPRYVLSDVREAAYGTGYDLVFFIFGEFNVFSREDAEHILEKAHRALAPGGQILLEAHTLDAVRKIGELPRSWHAVDQGLFSDDPHVSLYESFWDAEGRTTTERYFIVDAATGDVTLHGASIQAYAEEEYRRLLEDHGFQEIAFYPSLLGDVDETAQDLFVLVGHTKA